MKTEPDLKIVGLSIWTDGRQFPASGDYWDANWLDLRVRMEASGATVKCDGSFMMTSDFQSFRDQLQKLYDSLEGKALLEGLEPELKVTMTAKALGSIEVEVEITPDHMAQFHRFEFGINQSYVPEIMQSLDRILERFPVLHANR